jgi:hypothetical protein
VLVGALHGSLYALPADHLMLTAATAVAAADNGASPGTAAVVWPKRTGRMPLDITPAVLDVCAAGPAAGKQLPSSSSSGAGAVPSPNGSNEGDDSSGSALALLDESDVNAGVVALNPVDNGAVLDELSTLTCPQPPLGIHPITVQQGQTVGWLPLGAASCEVRARLHGVVVVVTQRQLLCRLEELLHFSFVGRIPSRHGHGTITWPVACLGCDAFDRLSPTACCCECICVCSGK